MLFKVVGVYSGVSKEGNAFYRLHTVELERTQKGLTGHSVDSYYCTPEVAAKIVPDNVYDLQSSFGSRTVCGAVLVEE